MESPGVSLTSSVEHTISSKNLKIKMEKDWGVTSDWSWGLKNYNRLKEGFSTANKHDTFERENKKAHSWPSDLSGTFPYSALEALIWLIWINLQGQEYTCKWLTCGHMLLSAFSSWDRIGV